MLQGEMLRGSSTQACTWGMARHSARGSGSGSGSWSEYGSGHMHDHTHSADGVDPEGSAAYPRVKSRYPAGSILEFGHPHVVGQRASSVELDDRLQLCIMEVIGDHEAASNRVIVSTYHNQGPAMCNVLLQSKLVSKGGSRICFDRGSRCTSQHL